jgi:hypothetical protein
VIERYSVEGQAFHNPELAREVVRSNPDVIVAITKPVVSISKRQRPRSRSSAPPPIPSLARAAAAKSGKNHAPPVSAIRAAAIILSQNITEI